MTKTHFHWKNIAKITFVLSLLTGAFYLFLSNFEVDLIVTAIIGVVIGYTAAIMCYNRWKPWHLELID